MTSTAAMTHDASAAALLQYLATVEQRCRAVRMRQQEVDMKAAHAAEERHALERDAVARQRDEAALCSELDALAREQQQVQLSDTAEVEQLRRCEAEEPLLLQHVTAQLAHVERDTACWQAQQQELHDMHTAWTHYAALDELTRSLQNAEQRIADDTAACARLERELRDGDAAEAALRAAQQQQQQRDSDKAAAAARARTQAEGDDDDDKDAEQRQASSPVRADAAVAEASVQRAREALRAAEYAAAQATAQHTRRCAVLRREVDDLDSRAAELTRWSAEMRAAQTHTAATLAAFARCVDAHACLQCIDTACTTTTTEAS